MSFGSPLNRFEEGPYIAIQDEGPISDVLQIPSKDVQETVFLPFCTVNKRFNSKTGNAVDVQFMHFDGFI